LRVPSLRIERLAEVGGIESVLHNFQVTTLRDEELNSIFRLQSCLDPLGSKCYEDAVVE
jgi:hypothetical protein